MSRRQFHRLSAALFYLSLILNFTKPKYNLKSFCVILRDLNLYSQAVRRLFCQIKSHSGGILSLFLCVSGKSLSLIHISEPTRRS